MDAFYVSVELRRRPELRGRPVVVGGSGGRGVVAAASYEARAYGVKSAMPSVTARRLCADAVFLPPDMDHYLDVSRQLREIFEEFSPLVEQISVDEAFIDVSGARRLLGEPTTIARDLRRRVRDETDLACSVGIASNKFIAKMASEFAKPRVSEGRVAEGSGVHVVEDGDEVAFLAPLPVGALWGVGPATLRKLESIGVATIGDLSDVPLSILVNSVGVSHGEHLHRLSRGIDDRRVEPERVAKSIGHEETFASDVTTHDEARAHLVRLCDAVSRRTRAAGVSAGTLLLKVKFSSFDSITRSVTPSVPLTTGPSMVAALEPLLRAVDVSAGVRLLGVHAQKLSGGAMAATSLFPDFLGDGPSEAAAVEEQWQPASRAVDSITGRFGPTAIAPASSLGSRSRLGQTPFGPVGETADDTPDGEGHGRRSGENR
jgi:DNA polymerase-4